MDDLVLWLGQQLDEDERLARAATPGPWSRMGRRVLDPTPPSDRLGIGMAVGHAAADADFNETADHIVRHDPARVLREVDAKRQLIDDYVVTARIRDEAAARIKAAGDHPDSKDLDTWDRAQREAAILEGPVKLAASPLSERPGYREEWRP